MSCVGSPPRMRGKAAFVVGGHSGIRITPACAGKRRWCVPHRSRSGDHPRVCGEKALSTFSSRKNSGSPPHVRGKGGMSESSDELVRVTPAYAGKRASRTIKTCAWSGSPPHVRGKAQRKLHAITLKRITLACAGKSLTESCGSTGKKDHPRTCGEKAVLLMCSCHSRGSPPHMRGKVR